MDEDEDEIVAAERSYGRAESNVDSEVEHIAHPAGWLYLPDMQTETGYITHVVPREPAPKPREPGNPLGFRRR